MIDTDREKIKKVVELNGETLKTISVRDEPDEKLECPITVIVNTRDYRKHSLILMDLDLLELESFPYNPYYFKVRGAK